MTQRYLDFQKTDHGIIMTPTPDGVEAAQELVESGKPDADAECEMLEWHLCNGWMMIPPEVIGALTSAPIISEDFTLNDDSEYEPVSPTPTVYAFMNYAVESAVQTWAEGKPVFWRKYQ